MSKFPRLSRVALILLLGSVGSAYGSELPYDSWRLGFFAPNYMEVWIETADVVDINNRWFKRAGSGVASLQTPQNFKGNPRGWPKKPGAGAGRQVTGADLPRFVYVRWQSLAEPQTYFAYVEIPEATRAAMIKGEKTYCRGTGKWITDYRDNLAMGLAPGGVVKTWIKGSCLHAIEVSRVQGKVVKEGPSLGKNNGRYALPLEPESKAYIDKFGIPYGSW